MGDRANIHTHTREDTGIYLYTHWGGFELPGTLKAALKRRQRWDDDAYLNRIIFCEMVKNHVGEETGFGISTYMPDNQYPIIEVMVDSQVIQIGARSWTFEEYIEDGPENFEGLRE